MKAADPACQLSTAAAEFTSLVNRPLLLAEAGPVKRAPSNRSNHGSAGPPRTESCEWTNETGRCTCGKDIQPSFRFLLNALYAN